MEMKSRAVKLFCAIAESGSLLAASNKLNLSSSAASRMLSQLEDRLGVKLFERGNKQLVLSEEGSNFYRVAHEAMKVWKVLEDYSAHRKAKRRLLRTAVMARHCSDVTLPAITKVLKRHEKVLKVTIDIHDSRDMYYSKYSHPFDIGFGTLLSDHDDLEKRIMAQLPMRLVVSKQNPLSAKDIVAPSDYRDENFILLSHDMLERKLTDTLTPNLSEDQVVGESDDCKAIPIDVPLTIPFSVFWPKSDKGLNEEAKECISEIAESIEKVGIPLTNFGKSFLKKRASNQAQL